MASVFEEDEISYFDGKTLKCGLVLESSEFASSDEDEDNPYVPKLTKGAIRVAWHPDGTEQELDEAKVKLADRSLMPGDVVRRMIEGEDSQRGYVRTTHVNCHIQIIGTNRVLCNIDSKLLQPIMFWDPEPGDVTLDSWVGKIECTNEQVFLSLPDGATCVVDDDEYLVELYEFEDLTDKRDKDSEFFMKDYYPGQRLRGELGVLEQANWTKTTSAHSAAAAKKHPEKKVTVTVVKTEPKSIDVHWLCRGYAKADDPLEQMGAPPTSLPPNDVARLKKLDCFESCSVQIGDKAFYTIRENDVLMDVPTGRKNLLSFILDKNKTQAQAEDCATQDLNARNKAASEKNSKNTEEAVAQEEKVPTDGAEEKPDEKSQTPAQTPESPVKAVEGDDSDYEDEEDSASDAESTASAKSNTSNSSASKAKIIVKKTGVGSSSSLQNKLMRKKKYKKQRRKVKKTPKQYKAGDRVAVEIVYTFSTIDVMWQDAVIERDIPSVDLYPIHHLDELEFFPGDFVIRNTDEGHKWTEEELASIESSYGVVEKVDHRGRCCLVRWMKPYQVGKSSRPDQSIAPEEASVYDIKDHPDYKFRPGHVVVRVGGYEDVRSRESHSEAAGQVYELSADGRLLIRWANGRLSHCWPQELFLIGDELEDMESLELSSSDDESSSDDSDDSDNQSGGSWETEDEDETVAPDKTDGTKELTVEAEKKIELDQLLETARSTLQKLEDMFSQNVEINPYAVHCYSCFDYRIDLYREILHIYRNCRELDSMLNATYFNDPTLAENVGAIKTELKKERSAKMTKQVQELFECNVRLPGESDAVQTLVTDESTANDTKEASPSPSDTANSSPISDSKSSESANCDSAGATGDSTAVELSDVKLESKTADSAETESSTNLCKGAVAKNTVDSKDAQETEDGSAAQVSDSSKEASPTKESGACDEDDKKSKKCRKSSGGEGTRPKESASVAGLAQVNRKAKDLCQTTCRLLKEQIMKVHDDLDRQWQVLREAGVILTREDVEKEEEKSANDQKKSHSVETQTAEPEASSTEDKPKPAETVTPPGGKTTPNVTPPRPKMELKLKNTTSAESSPAAPAPPTEPPTPQTPAEIREKILYNKDGFKLLERCPLTHKFYSQDHAPADIKTFLTAVKKELKMLNTSLPIGIYVKGFEDRMDLFSVMILGPTRTPYEDGLFFFDVQLSNNYPATPPSVHYISFCSDRLNPNLYEDGKVCVSLLGTWQGRGTEVWTNKSSLLQVLISIQGLILVSEPYYNEAGYEKQKGTQQGQENSRMYNEMAILKMLQSMMKMTVNPPSVFETEVKEHMNRCALRMIRRLHYWLDLSSTVTSPITSPSASATQLAAAAPSGESNATSAPPAGGIQSGASVESKEDENKGAPASAQSSDSGIASDMSVSSKESKDAAAGSDGSQSQAGADGSGSAAPPLGASSLSPSSAAGPSSSSTTAVFWKPEFPLLPGSRGFCLSMTKTLPQFSRILATHGIKPASS